MKKILLLTLAVMGAAAMPALADMTYAPFLFEGLDASGNPIANGTYSMILDLDGDGWNGNPYTDAYAGFGPGNDILGLLWDADDLLMDFGQIADGVATPFSSIPTTQIPAGYNANVDHYFLFWFDTPFTNNPFAPLGAGINYGAEDLGAVGTDPGDYTPFAVGGSAFLTTVVPEPISGVLLLIGGGAMVLRRRFKATPA